MRTLLRILLIFGVLFLLIKYVFAILFPRGGRVAGRPRGKKSSISEDRIQDANFRDISQQ